MKYILKLYVTEGSSNSMRAIKNLKKILEVLPEDKYEIEIINLLKNPELSIIDGIIATPTLIKSYPLPPRKVIGDLSDVEKVIYGLGLRDFMDVNKNGR
jgi:circadian clock protein KaiB